MHVRIHLRWRRTVAAVLLPALIGCTGPLDPTTRPALPATGSSPSSAAQTAVVGPAAQAGFYPLRVGNRWDYLQTVLIELVPNSGQPPPVELSESVIRREIIGARISDGREYMLEQVTETSPGGSFESIIESRQDMTGLYEFSPVRASPVAGGRATGARDARTFSWVDTAAMERLLEGVSPAEREAYRLAARRLDDRVAALSAVRGIGTARPSGRRLPGTASPYEITRLRYPLEPKARWALRSDVPFLLTAEVVGAETVRLARTDLSAYRIRLWPQSAGPNDRLEVWYGPSGFLQLDFHIELAAVDAVDVGGGVIGRWIFDQRQILTDLSLVGSDAFTLPPWFETPRK